MVNYQNLSTSRLSWLIALAFVGSSALLFLLLLVINTREIKYAAIISVAIAIIYFTVSYFLIRRTLEQVVFRKIKLIYNMIRSSKMDNIELALETNADLETVNKDVLEWAEKTEKEIETLKTLEEYRRNFVGNISHELKTPIFSIQGFLHTLLDGGLYDEKINKLYIERAASNADRLQTIVEDLETINKFEAGAVDIEFEKFNVKTLCEEVRSDLELMAKKKKVKIIFKDDADQAFNVLADKEGIRQVLTNLMTNSVKYTEPSGATEISFYDMDDLVLIEISDQGIGIDEKHLKHLFDRFYRVDTSRSRRQGGSGLGLSIVKHILEAHNQNIFVRSTVGIGSTFGFTMKKV